MDAADGTVDGVATIPLTLSEGSHLLSAESTDVAGNVSAQSAELVVTVDRTAPAAPSVPDMLATSDTGVSDSDNITSIDQPAFVGTAEPNALVRIYADGLLVGQGVATSAGNYEITVEPLAIGTYNITAEAEDLAGNVSDCERSPLSDHGGRATPAAADHRSGEFV